MIEFNPARTRARAWPAFAKLTLFTALSALTLFVLRLGAQPIVHLGNMQPPLTRLFVPAAPPTAEPALFNDEFEMSRKAMLDRWTPFIAEASRRFSVPVSWIRAVMSRESGGRTMSDAGLPITSSAGAVGVMQVMPETYDEMRAEHGLGANPYDPHDNIIAGTAYMRQLYRRYGFPEMFAAYNDGPGNFDEHLAGHRALPAETVAYLDALSSELGAAPRSRRGRRRGTHTA